MTSLIDVIFLLLLFFMLSSTFTRFSEVDLGAGTAGLDATKVRPVFLQLAPDALRLNGSDVALGSLPTILKVQHGAMVGAPLPVLVSLRPGVTAQRLTDLLVVLRQVSGVQATVLGAA